MQHTGAVERFDEIGRQLENNLAKLTLVQTALKKRACGLTRLFPQIKSRPTRSQKALPQKRKS